MFIFPPNTLQSCHAPSLEITPSGLVCAWFAGFEEGSWDTSIWFSSYEYGLWSTPKQIAAGYDENGRQTACWNPVLFQLPDGALLLFYRVGKSPQTWWSMMQTSKDNGATWTAAQQLPKGYLGPIKNKPKRFNNLLVCPSSTEANGWKCHIECYDTYTQTWLSKVEIPSNNIEAIQPALLIEADRWLVYCRTKTGIVAFSESFDNGHSWSPLHELAIKSPNAALDAVALDKYHIICLNQADQGDETRNKLAYVKWDGSTILEHNLLDISLFDDEFSYPSLVLQENYLHIAYTYNRIGIQHRIVNLGDVNP